MVVKYGSKIVFLRLLSQKNDRKTLFGDQEPIRLSDNSCSTLLEIIVKSLFFRQLLLLMTCDKIVKSLLILVNISFLTQLNVLK